MLTEFVDAPMVVELDERYDDGENRQIGIGMLLEAD